MLPHLPRRSPSAARDDGFTLLEVIVALGIVVVIVTALAQLVAMSVRANVLARTTTTATILAQQKMEELLSEAAADLEPSPAGALTQNIDGSFDFLASRRSGGGERRGAATGERLRPPLVARTADEFGSRHVDRAGPGNQRLQADRLDRRPALSRARRTMCGLPAPRVEGVLTWRTELAASPSLSSSSRWR